MKTSFILLSLAATAYSSALPLEARAPKECAANVIISLLKINAQATKFCSTFLNIQPATSTLSLQATITPAEATVTDTTATVYITRTADDAVVQTVYTSTKEVVVATVTQPAEVVTQTSFVATVTATVPMKRRRSLEERDPQRGAIPAFLKAFASKEISSACSCLSIAPSTSVITVRATVTAAASTKTVNVAATSSVVIGTVIVKADSTLSVTTTVPGGTSTKIVSQTSTSTVRAQPTQCANLGSSPVNYQNAGLLVIAGVGRSNTISSASSAEACCNSCYSNGNCFGFSYGNYDPTYSNINDISAPPPVTPDTRCYNYVIVTGGCNFDHVAFGPSRFGSSPAGGSASFGFGVCSVSRW